MPFVAVGDATEPGEHRQVYEELLSRYVREVERLYPSAASTYDGAAKEPQ